LLQRKPVLVHSVSIIVGTVIGSGVFINLPVVARNAGSPLLATLAWLIGGLIWIPQVFFITEMATAYPGQRFGCLYLIKTRIRRCHYERSMLPNKELLDGESWLPSHLFIDKQMICQTG
jgi:hypothetical protein